MLFLLCGVALGGEVSLGSYGRVQVSGDASGGQGEAVNVVSFGTRLEKGPYLEMDFVYQEETDGADFRAVITPALSGQLFHYDGVWDTDLALRNLFVEATGFEAPVTVWAGSRMYRGDDVHLLDFWPMDDLNTVGGGASLHPGQWNLAAHVGLNRLEGQDWQSQVYPVPEPGGVGTEDVRVLDRQRSVVSGTVSRILGSDSSALRLKGYGEWHRLPEGARIVEDLLEEPLPADRGAVLGAQVSGGGWGWGNHSFVHAWYRLATGLAAYDEMAIPTDGLAPDNTVTAARQHRVALAGNSETERFGVLVGAYIQRFDDADGLSSDVDDRWEGNLAARPAVFIGEHGYLGAEISHQWLRPDGLNPRTEAHDIPQVTKLAILPAIQPRPGSFARPQLRLQYVASILNDEARLWYSRYDERARYNLQHFVGIGAEWWLNSAGYGD